MAKVIFSVGVKHPLYNKVVEAEIITRNGGFNKRTIEAITKEEVYFPSDPKGIFIMNKFGDIVGYKERAAFSEKWQGWVNEIVEDDDVPTYFDAHIFDFNSGNLLSENFSETTPYYKGEDIDILENSYKVVCVSEIVNGIQSVFVIEY